MSAAPAGPWTSVLTFFDERAAGNAFFEPMRTLAHELANSTYAAALHPWTSMHDLCISQTEPTYPHDIPHLRISLRSPSEMEFRYIDTGDPQRQWRRTESPTRAIARLESFFGFSQHLKQGRLVLNRRRRLRFGHMEIVARHTRFVPDPEPHSAAFSLTRLFMEEQT
jgi:hypothetical protein